MNNQMRAIRDASRHTASGKGGCVSNQHSVTNREALRVIVTVAPPPTEADIIDNMLCAFSSWLFYSSIDSTADVGRQW
eukprot:COSAG01_NODE_1987_length_8707_cov_2.906366_4_plen_78_part_00